MLQSNVSGLLNFITSKNTSLRFFKKDKQGTSVTTMTTPFGLLRKPIAGTYVRQTTNGY